MSFLRVVARAAPVRPFVQVQTPRLALQALARVRLPPRAFFAAAAGGLRKEEIEARILDIVKSFEKVEPGNVKSTSTFQELALDSLDTVELIVAIEEEFSIEIPDDDADAIDSVVKAIAYIENTPEAS